MMEHPEKELCEQSAQGSFKPEQESVEKLAAKVESAGTEATQSQKNMFVMLTLVGRQPQRPQPSNTRKDQGPSKGESRRMHRAAHYAALDPQGPTGQTTMRVQRLL